MTVYFKQVLPASEVAKAIDPLAILFANVPLLSDEVVRNVGKEMPDDLIIDAGGAPIADPIEWMKRSRIRYLHEPMRSDWAGVFRGRPEIGDCLIQTNPCYGKLDSPEVVRVLWHEIGHAIDHISEDGETLVVRPNRYSSEHEAVLKEHADFIVSLRLASEDATFAEAGGDWIAYASQPRELWAEAVALAVCRPAILRPTKLWPVLKSILPGRAIAIPETMTDVLLTSAEKDIGAPVVIDLPEAHGEAEGARQPFPAFNMPALMEACSEDKFPVTIYTMLKQMGGFSLNGALTAVGCCAEKVRDMRWKHPKRYYDGECRGSGAKWLPKGSNCTPDPVLPGGPSCKGPGHLDYDVGIDFPVNGAPGDWRMAVTYEPDDTYAVWLWCESGHLTGLLDSRSDVYCDALDEVIDRCYTRAIENFNEGVFPGIN